jgi:hypothetical protein
MEEAKVSIKEEATLIFNQVSCQVSKEEQAIIMEVMLYLLEVLPIIIIAIIIIMEPIEVLLQKLQESTKIFKCLITFATNLSVFCPLTAAR